jgi:hypothetical protein
MRICFLQVVLLTLAVSTARAQRTSESPSVPDPHHHPVPVHQKPWHNDIAPDARFIRLEHPAAGHDTVLSPNRRWRAFVRDRQDEQGGRVCLQDVKTGEQYELKGIPLPYRPISGLIWLDDTLLTFDRWSQPHYGIHYVINTERLRVVLSTPFPDEFFLRQQGVKKDTVEQHR